MNEDKMVYVFAAFLAPQVYAKAVEAGVADQRAIAEEVWELAQAMVDAKPFPKYQTWKGGAQ